MEQEVTADSNRLNVGFAEKELLVIADDRKDERKFRGQESTKRLVAVGVGVILIGALNYSFDRPPTVYSCSGDRPSNRVRRGGRSGWIRDRQGQRKQVQPLERRVIDSEHLMYTQKPRS